MKYIFVLIMLAILAFSVWWDYNHVKMQWDYMTHHTYQQSK